jgi:asparagine synthase (glutamine-hydrolysing)
MCGILGVYNFDRDSPVDIERFNSSLDTLLHRGPDDSGIACIKPNLVFGHRRLSIIDLSNGSHQPFELDERYVLTYNGEIFNYIEIREELTALGEVFQTSGDVEVLLRAYKVWGTECVTRFNGMWAFAIYDRENDVLFASRDRFGIKPLNYSFVAGSFIFSSEIKAMLSYAPSLNEPDYNMIANFCRFSVGAQSENSWFKQVKRLMPAHNLIIRNGEVEISRYWDYPDFQDRDDKEVKLIEEYRSIFLDAVKVRMRTDVPVGITLSGGVDSTSIVYSMKHIEDGKYFCLTSTFQADQQLRTSASVYADRTAIVDEASIAQRSAVDLGLPSKVVETDYEDFLSQLEQIIWHLECGNSAPAVFPLNQLYKVAADHMTVVMDGQGADELLAGYIDTIVILSVCSDLRSGRIRSAFRSIKIYRETYSLSAAIMIFLRIMSNRWTWIGSLQQKLQGLDTLYGEKLNVQFVRVADAPVVKSGSRASAISKMLQHQHQGTLVSLLHYGDALSMASSLEARMPFLDHRLVEFVWRLPDLLKFRDGIGKYVHRAALRDLVPDDILWSKLKWGFSTPIGHVLRTELNRDTKLRDFILGQRASDRGLFDNERLSQLLDRHQSGKADHGPLLLRLFMVEAWFRRFIDGATNAVPSSEPTGSTLNDPDISAISVGRVGIHPS